MDLAGCHFTYANVSSRTYGLWFAHCDTSDYLSINGNTKSVTVFNSHENRQYFVADSYNSSPISIDVEFLVDTDRVLSVKEIRDIEKWLFNRNNYYKLYIDIADDCLAESYQIIDGREVPFYFNCRFTNPTKIQGFGGIVGFRARMECDSYLLWQDSITKTFSVGGTSSSSSNVVTINIDSDVEDYVYPKVTITMAQAGGDIYITNNSDDISRITSFKSLTGEIQLIMNSKLNYISGNNYMKFYDRNFIRLIPGTNNIGIVGAVSSITFEWENRRYL